MKLVADWKQAWKWISVNCMVIAAAIQGAWLYIPEDMKTSVPQSWVHVLTIGLLIAGVAGRVVQQGNGNATPPVA